MVQVLRARLQSSESMNRQCLQTLALVKVLAPPPSRAPVPSPVAHLITPPFQHTSFTLGSLGLAARSASKMGWSFRPTMTKCSTGLAIAGKRQRLLHARVIRPENASLERLVLSNMTCQGPSLAGAIL